MKHPLFCHNRGMRYIIGEQLTEAPDGAMPNEQFVDVLTPDQWRGTRDLYDFGIDIEPDWDAALDSQAEENYDSITGTIHVPDRLDLSEEGAWFSFALDEKGIVFIDPGNTAATMVRELAHRRWRKPGLERFLYDFLQLLVRGDNKLLGRYERELDRIEDDVVSDSIDGAYAGRINEIRSDMRDLDGYFEHLQDMVTVFEENENGFFADENLRYFRLLDAQLEKLRDKTNQLSIQAQQVRDLYKMHLDIRQNNIMTVLTVVTAIFAPLTLIVGWYGMNFEHMPELAWPISYPAVFVLCVLIAVGLVVYFKRRRWL